MVAELKSLIENANSIALLCHVNADMDALGSAMGLCLVLKNLGKKAVVYAPEEVAHHYRFLSVLDDVRLADGEIYDLAIGVDVSDKERMGDGNKVFENAKEQALIDHHGTTVPFTKVHLIRPEAAATAEILTHLFAEYGWSIPKDAANCLHAGLSTDTGNFSYDCVTKSTFLAAAICVQNGAEPAYLTEHLYRTQTEGHVRIKGRVLDKLERVADGKIVLMQATEQDFADTGASQEDVNGIINEGLSIEGAAMAALLYKRGDGIKASLRAKAPYDVAAIAQQFGGGGHIRAAGCSFACELEEAKNTIRKAMEEAL